ncbi:hypothetical protein K439DRAFT_1617496 [Ramaria rubella]|nr:hypothetical protein K439DRAFT_1617496 [Ramaria rubella]
MKLSAEEEEEIIRRAMDGDENSTYFVPLVVSDGREDKDKAGKPSLVFDALLSPTLKSRMTKDFNFKSFVLEIILSHIESPPQTPGTLPTRSLSLSRTLGTPNIRSKGPLEPREVEVPDFGQIQGDNIRTVTNTADIPVTPGLRAASTEFAAKKPLIEEIPPSAKPSAMDTRKPKSILKTEASDHRRQEHEAAAPMLDAHTKTEVDAGLEVPAWRWEDEGLVAGQKLIIETPKLVSLNGDVEVDTAKAEWRVGEGRLVIYM